MEEEEINNEVINGDGFNKMYLSLLDPELCCMSVGTLLFCLDFFLQPYEDNTMAETHKRYKHVHVALSSHVTAKKYRKPINIELHVSSKISRLLIQQATHFLFSTYEDTQYGEILAVKYFLCQIFIALNFRGPSYVTTTHTMHTHKPMKTTHF